MMNYGNKNGLIKLSIVKLEPSTNFTDDNQPILSPLSKDHKTPKVARSSENLREEAYHGSELPRSKQGQT